MSPNLVRVPALLALTLTLAACGGHDDTPAGPDEPMPEQPAVEAGRADADEAVRPERPAPPPELDAAADPDAAAEPAGAALPEVFAGEWVVSGHRFGGVSALDDATAAQLHGRELDFGTESTRSGEDLCPQPQYAASRGNVLEVLLTGYRTNPVELGLEVGTEATVEQLEVSCTGMPWTTLGATLLAVDGQVLAPWEGVFFELRRR